MASHCVQIPLPQGQNVNLTDSDGRVNGLAKRTSLKRKKSAGIRNTTDGDNAGSSKFKISREPFKPQPLEPCDISSTPKLVRRVTGQQLQLHPIFRHDAVIAPLF